MAQLERERLYGVYVDKDLKYEIKEESVRERRELKDTASDALRLYLAVKRGDVTIVHRDAEGN